MVEGRHLDSRRCNYTSSSTSKKSDGTTEIVVKIIVEVFEEDIVQINKTITS